MAYKQLQRYFKQFPFLTSPWSVLTLFAVLGLIGVFNHAMWRDEFNTWLIVRDSGSLGEMLGRVKYQGHTALWALCLSFLRNFSQSPVIMQLFHWAIAVLSVAIFWFCSPFTHRQKILFTFGYLPFYQYLLIARPYVLGMLFLFIFCAIFPFRRKSYIPAAVMLALMANSSAYALFIAIALLATLTIEFSLDREARSRYWQQSKSYDLILSLLIVTASFGFAFYILTPPVDSYNHGGLDAWKLRFDLRRVFRAWGRVFGGYTLMLPEHKRWLDLIASGLITLLAVLVFLLRLVQKPLAFCFFILAYLEILAFSYLRFMGIGPRHFGHFYLVLIAAFWLASYLPESTALTKRLKLSPSFLKFGNKWHQLILTTIITIQFLAGLYGLPRDLLIPFSASRATANYIRASGWQDEFIVASRDANMAPISGYLDRLLYYPELQGMGSFTLFGGDRESDDHKDAISHEEVLAHVQELLSGENLIGRILLVLHEPLEIRAEGLEIESIREFTRSWTASERYYLYWVRLS
ncbi:MAG: hypothetical protein AAGE59_25770 [Cyanobacteria bacterium P01_F01_bin.86]